MKSIVRSTWLLTFVAVLAVNGCQREEKILDVEAPGINIEVKKTGNDHIDVKIDEKHE